MNNKDDLSDTDNFLIYRCVFIDDPAWEHWDHATTASSTLADKSMCEIQLPDARITNTSNNSSHSDDLLSNNTAFSDTISVTNIIWPKASLFQQSSSTEISPINIHHLSDTQSSSNSESSVNFKRSDENLTNQHLVREYQHIRQPVFRQQNIILNHQSSSFQIITQNIGSSSNSHYQFVDESKNFPNKKSAKKIPKPNSKIETESIEQQDVIIPNKDICNVNGRSFVFLNQHDQDYSFKIQHFFNENEMRNVVEYKLTFIGETEISNVKPNTLYHGKPIIDLEKYNIQRLYFRIKDKMFKTITNTKNKEEHNIIYFKDENGKDVVKTKKEYLDHIHDFTDRMFKFREKPKKD